MVNNTKKNNQLNAQNKNASFRIDSNKSFTFSLKKERKLIPAATKDPANPDSTKDLPEPEKPKKKYFYEYSPEKTKKTYKEFLLQIPKWKGAVIIYGINENETKHIDCIYSNYNLRETFSKSVRTIENEKTNRFSWMEWLLLTQQYKDLKIYTASSI